MKKIGMVVLATLLLVSTASAYNPPVQGENFLELSTPKLLSGTITTAGGGLFTISPESIILNPALTATEQRTDVNLAYTALFSGNTFSLNHYGNTVQTSILIPSKLYVFTGLINFTSVGFAEMNLGNSLNLKANLSKQITDKIDVGLGLSGGIFWTSTFDWSLSGNIGALFKLGDLGFLKDFRIGASVLNLGKSYATYDLVSYLYRNTGDESIDQYRDNSSTPFPSFGMIRMGVAGQVITTDKIKLGVSFDVATPFFQNILFDIGLQLTYQDKFYLGIVEKLNCAEMIKGYAHFIPAIGASYKFVFNVNNIQYLESNGWSQSEMRVSAAYKNLYQTVNAISADVDITLGMKDATPPVIQLWDNEGDDD